MNVPALVDSRGQPMQASNAVIDQDGRGGLTAFSFGDPEPVLERDALLAYIEAVPLADWYHPPVSQCGLARAFDMPGPHASCIRLKVNLLSKFFIPSRWLDRPTFRKYALDFLAIGNGYLEVRDNLAGRPMRLEHSLGRYMRRGIEPGRYFFVPEWKREHEFARDHVFHLLQEHPSQEIYGVPEFFPALQAGLLDEAATLFRRRYFKNGSHAGYVFYVNDTKIADKDIEGMRKALRDAKGPGNFRNLFIHSPGAGEKGVQIIPVGEAAAKDEFFNVKRVSRNEMLAAHRTPPQLVAIVPENNGGFGDALDARVLFMDNEIEPLMARLAEVNDWLGLEAVRFEDWREAIAPSG